MFETVRVVAKPDILRFLSSEFDELPYWKQGVLEASMRAQNSEPRPPVLVVDENETCSIMSRQDQRPLKEQAVAKTQSKVFYDILHLPGDAESEFSEHTVKEGNYGNDSLIVVDAQHAEEVGPNFLEWFNEHQEKDIVYIRYHW